MADLFKAFMGIVASKIGALIVGTISASFLLVLILGAMVIFAIIGGTAGSSNNMTEANTGGQYSCSVDGELDQDAWDNYFNNQERSNAFYGFGDTILDVSESQGVDPVLVAAIMIHETGNGTSNAVMEKNNPGGIMDWEQNWSTTRTFSSLEEGIHYTIANLKSRYMDQGLLTIEEIGPVYAPIDAVNDPDGLNQNWIPKVNQYAADLGGLIMNCDLVDTVEIIGDTVFPVPYTKNITSHFQRNRLNPVTGEIKDHTGIDIASQGINGTPAVSFMDGTVTFTGNYGGGGNAVFVEHMNGIKTGYLHLQSINVSDGQSISAGETVGLIGSTGNSTGPHLHFEIIINGTHVDPYPYLQPFIGE